jgi:hypothetical protein
MHRTVRSQVAGCGIISDVRRGRAVTWVAVWALGVAVALFVAWLGVRTVLRSTIGPLVPVVDPSPARAGTSGSPAGTDPASGPSASHQPGSSPAPEPAASSAPASAGEHPYGITGGHVVLRITSARCFLVSATPEAGFTAENWSSMGWLRIDFNQGGNEVSSLTCDWYQQAPTVTIGS